MLTGVYFDEAELGAAVYDRGEIAYLMSRKIPGFYHGTGDVFGSALLAGIMEGLTLDSATDAAIELTVESIERTWQAGTDVRFGVNFEAGLGDFAARLRQRKNA